MTDTGTCLLLEGEKVRAILVAAYGANLVEIMQLGPQVIEEAAAFIAQGSPLALMLARSASMTTIGILYSALLGEELKGALSGNG